MCFLCIFFVKKRRKSPLPPCSSSSCVYNFILCQHMCLYVFPLNCFFSLFGCFLYNFSMFWYFFLRLENFVLFVKVIKNLPLYHEKNGFFENSMFVYILKSFSWYRWLIYLAIFPILPLNKDVVWKFSTNLFVNICTMPLKIM